MFPSFFFLLLSAEISIEFNMMKVAWSKVPSGLVLLGVGLFHFNQIHDVLEMEDLNTLSPESIHFYGLRKVCNR